jgi:hypothetical protein
LTHQIISTPEIIINNYIFAIMAQRKAAALYDDDDFDDYDDEEDYWEEEEGDDPYDAPVVAKQPAKNVGQRTTAWDFF